MKKNIIIILAIFLAGFNPVKGQYSYEYQTTTVKTPTGINVDALQFKYWLYDDFDEDRIADENNDWTEGYNCEIIENSTKFYNCHGYAWYTVEGNSSQSQLRWINNIDDYSNPTYNVQKYYSSTYSGGNPSYKEVSTNNNPSLKVSYFPRDHSSITDSETGYFVSKWAWGTLVKHLPAQCPFYPNSVIKYYSLIEPAISLPYSVLCNGSQQTVSESTFSHISLNYDWDVSGPLTEVDGDGTSSYTVAGTSQSGVGVITLTITTPSGATATVSRDVWIGPPAPPIFNRSSPFFAPINSSYSVRIETPGADISTANWGSSGCISLISASADNASFLTCPIDGCGDIYVTTSNNCGSSNNSTLSVISGTGGDCMSIDSFSPISLSLYPNPASTETTLAIHQGKSNTVSDNTEWELEIYDKVQQTRIKKSKYSGKNAKINISGLPNDIYIVRVKIGNEIISEKLVVKH
jgi:hypothetical protein